ncbi:MAG: permease, partial [Chloroflexi bacterium]|nr:permease [Chloroflexota bacterium]
MEKSPSIARVAISDISDRLYIGWLIGFAACLGLLLLTTVDVRRAFLFPFADYLKIGWPSVVLNLDLRHLPLLAVGIFGGWVSYRRLSGLDSDLQGRSIGRLGLTRLLGGGLLALFVVDLFIYRGVPASRIVAAGKTTMGQVAPPFLLDGWLRPLGEAINYLALVWHATALGILIASLFLTLIMPLLKGWLGREGFRSHLAGAFLALGQPFCSCCAAPVGASLYRGGASLGSTLAFVVSAPMLNLTSIVLAITLLPREFALLRVAGGAAMGILVTYFVSVAGASRSDASAVLTPANRLEMQPKTGNMQRPANSVPTRRSELFARPAVAPHIVPKSGCDSPPLF